MRARRSAVLFGLLGVLVSAPATSAAVPITTITIDVDFAVPEEPFTTTGGVVCPAGFAVSDPVSIVGGGAHGRGAFTFHVVKTMYCDNGDTFKLLVDVVGSPTAGGTVGGLAAGQGTGGLTGLHGGGSLVGTPTEAGIHDLYTGRLTIAP
jgi:hypothetical protein